MTYLQLFNGHNDPQDVSRGAGFFGPRLGPFETVTVRGGAEIQAWHPGYAGKLTLGIDSQGFVPYGGAYYFGFELQSE